MEGTSWEFLQHMLSFPWAASSMRTSQSQPLWVWGTMWRERGPNFLALYRSESSHHVEEKWAVSARLNPNCWSTESWEIIDCYFKPLRFRDIFYAPETNWYSGIKLWRANIIKTRHWGTGYTGEISYRWYLTLIFYVWKVPEWMLEGRMIGI